MRIVKTTFTILHFVKISQSDRRIIMNLSEDRSHYIQSKKSKFEKVHFVNQIVSISIMSMDER